MRILALLFITFSFFYSSQAQKIKVKGDILYIDKVEFGTMKGEVSLIKPANYTLAAKDGSVIYTINEGSKLYHHPMVEDIYYYTITFGDSQEYLNIITKARCVGPKCLIKKFIKENGILPAVGGVKNQTEIISKFDQSEEIAQDTVKSAKIIKDYQDHAISASGPERDISKPVKFIKESENVVIHTTTTYYNLIQDSLFIGSIKVESKSTEDVGGRSTKYWIEKWSDKIHIID